MQTESQKAAAAKYKAANREKIKARNAAYRAANQGKIKALREAYRSDPVVKKHEVELAAKWKAEHPDEHRRHSREYAARNYIKKSNE